VIFVDASALLAILTHEDDADDLADRLEADPDRLCSALSVWETTVGLCRIHGLSVAAAQAHIDRFLAEADVRYVAIGAQECEIAAEAFARFGKGRHRAALNMGDCFAYACARSNNASLLFKGNDFVWTDIAAA